MAEKKDENIEEALEGMKDHASSITQYVDSFKKRIEDLEKQKAEAEEKTAKAEERVKNAEEQHAEALKKLGQVEGRESSNYAPLIKELFKEPQQELQRQMKSQGLWFFGISLAVVVLSIVISVSVISFYSVKSVKSAATMTPAAPTKIEAKLVQALAHLDEKTQKSINKISLETAKIAEDISYIARERRVVEEIALEIEKFQKEFAPVRTRNDVRLLYKMRLSPHHQSKYAFLYEALKTSNLPVDLVPTNLNDFYIWDRQMLHIFSRFVIDATKYGVWSIEIEDYSQLVAYLGKQIELYKKQILLNNREL